MDNPVAIITGAGRGIGRAAAVELAGRKYRVVLVSRTLSELQETARLCGESAMAISADLSTSDGVASVVTQTLTKTGRVDALVHCAGVATLGGVEEITAEEWQVMLETNLSASVYFCRLLWPVWRQRGGGVVVNISSVAARDPFDGLALYGATKAALNLLGLGLAREGKKINVRVHTIAPGATETAMFRSLMTPEQFPVDQTLDPAEVARVIAQCVCGDLAHTNGEVIYLRKNV